MADRIEYEIRPGLVIPAREVWFEFSHATGPGGQNVNKVATAATLCFHPDSSGALGPSEKAVVKARLANRINADGVLRIIASDGRSQLLNRLHAGERFRQLLEEVLRPRKKRRPTRPTRSSIQRRLADKRFRAARKSDRRGGEAELDA